MSKFVHRKKRYDNIADMKLQKAPHTFMENVEALECQVRTDQLEADY